MRNRLVILVLLVLVIGIVVAISLPVSGTCGTGINKTHLDPTPGAFVDNTTLEINSANGLQVKAIPNGSVSTAKIETIFGSWTDKDSQNNILVVNAVYKVTSDGVVRFTNTAVGGAQFTIIGYRGQSSNPTTEACKFKTGAIYAAAEVYTGFIFLKKNDYWKVTISGNDLSNLEWMPVGSGCCEKQ